MLVPETYYKHHFKGGVFIHKLIEVDEKFQPTGKTKLAKIPINFN